MNGMWEGGCKEGVVMVVVKRGKRSWKSWEGKEDGGRPQHHEPINFSKSCRVDICWRMETRSSSYGSYGNASVKIHEHCHNPNLRLVTKARACKVVGHEGSQGVTSHALGSAKECEGMNPHTPK